MTKIDIISGFLGAGKTTLIKKLLKEQLAGEKIVLIENEFGEIGIDGNLFKSADIEIKEMNAGCICCSLVGNFTAAIKEVLRRFSPDRILIEPSGVGKLSEVLLSCQKLSKTLPVTVNMRLTVADALKYRMYIRNFAEFYQNQLAYAETVVLSRTQKIDGPKLEAVVADIRRRNPSANILTTPWEDLPSSKILEIAESGSDDPFGEQLAVLARVQKHPGPAESGHSHAEDGHHHADDVFETWGQETPHLFEKAAIQRALDALGDERFGEIIRAKGIVPVGGGEWIQFDYVPGESSLRPIEPDYTGRLCVIGSHLDREELTKLFFET